MEIHDGGCRMVGRWVSVSVIERCGRREGKGEKDGERGRGRLIKGLKTSNV